MKLLILTDHSGHSVHNSLYRLAEALSDHQEVDQLYIASRADQRNQLFFNGKDRPFVYAIKHNEQFKYPANDRFEKEAKSVAISEFDALFLRIPRPIADAFFTYLKNHFNELYIVNRPSGIVETSNKSFLLTLDKFVEPMALCDSWGDILKFKESYDCVLKPLEEYGGRGIVRILKDQVSMDGATISMDNFYNIYSANPQAYLAMKYLENVSQGDKRIVVAGGEILTASLRFPAANNWLCNVAQGGRDEMTMPNKREQEIVAYIQPILAEKGIFYYGLDTLVNDEGDRVISEINTLSIGGIAPAELTTKRPLANIFASQFIRYLKEL